MILRYHTAGERETEGERRTEEKEEQDWNGRNNPTLSHFGRESRKEREERGIKY